MTVSRRDFLKAGPAVLATAKLPVQADVVGGCGYGSGAYGAGVYGGECATPTSVVATDRQANSGGESAPWLVAAMLAGATLVAARQRQQVAQSRAEANKLSSKP